MASKKSSVLVMAAALAVAFLPALAAATEHTVGDASGWTLGFDYAAWAATKQYYEPSHTVVEVGGADFAACKKPGDAVVMGTGDDRVTLNAPGRRWFVCSVGKHCQNGMKLKITVIDADEGAAPTVAPAPDLSMPPFPASSPAAGVDGHRGGWRGGFGRAGVLGLF
ncbi:hypothetical protein EJB05_04101, partial [Eragrostis curvula]